ncbi:MAG: hypothetical protein MJ153_07530, partial [Clostridia bacterium]|nr:hypothetical protein [Clostridia bacterium]
ETASSVTAVVDDRIALVVNEIEGMIKLDSYDAVYVATGDVNSDGNYEVYVSYGSTTYERFLKTQIFVIDAADASVSMPNCEGLLINPASVSDTDEQKQQLQYLRNADGEYLCAFNKDNRLAGVEEMIYCAGDKYTMEEIASFYIYVDKSTDDSSNDYQLYIEDKNTGEMPVADLTAIEEKYLNSVEERTVANIYWERYDKDDNLGALLTESLSRFSTVEDASISLPDYIEVSFDSNEYDVQNEDELTDEEKEILRRISNLKSQGY